MSGNERGAEAVDRVKRLIEYTLYNYGLVTSSKPDPSVCNRVSSLAETHIRNAIVALGAAEHESENGDLLRVVVLLSMALDHCTKACALDGKQI